MLWKSCCGVFEGGGVRGIGHVGAACAMQEAGYQFTDLAGSSAGAIAAALLAAGYSCDELKKEMESLDYMKFKGKGLASHFGLPGKAFSIVFRLGIYNTVWLEGWVEEMLKEKGIYTFGDLRKKGRILKITASDLTDRRLLILPDDLKDFGLDPDLFSIARAVRMSVGIPVFFQPVRLRDKDGREHLIVDGGLLSNYPLWILDHQADAGICPVFGFRFIDGKKKECKGGCSARPNLVDYLKSIVSTSLDAFDNSHLSAGDYERTVRIPTSVKIRGETKKIHAADFDITNEESILLFENGRRAAGEFLKSWDFDGWKRRYGSPNQKARLSGQPQTDMVE